MASIRKLPSGNYNVRVYDKKTGKQISLTSHSRQQLAIMAAEYESNIERRSRGEYTVAEAIDLYINSRTAVSSPATIRGYRNMQRNHYQELANVSVDRLTSELVQIHINTLSARLSPKSVRNIYALLTASIKMVRPNMSISASLPQKRPYQKKIHSDADIKKLLDNSSGNLKKAILLSAFGTVREGEISAIKYKDISGNTIHVHADMVMNEHHKWIYKDVPKNSTSDRYIEYPEKVISALGTGDLEEYVVPIKPNTIGKEYIKLRNKLGIPCRFHDLRAYAASIMHALGVPDQYIMKRGGWKTDTVLKAVYRGTMDDIEKRFTDITNQHSESLL